MVQELDGQGKIGALLERPGRGLHVAGGGAHVGEGAGVLIDAHEQEGGAHPADGRGRVASKMRLRCPPDLFDEQRGSGPKRLSLEGDTLCEWFYQLVVVDDVGAGVRVHAGQGSDGLCVHQEQVADALSGQVATGDEGQLVLVERQKVAQIAVEILRQHRLIVGV